MSKTKIKFSTTKVNRSRKTEKTLKAANKYTVCATVDFNENGMIEGSVLSYASERKDQALAIIYNSGSMEFWYNNEKLGSSKSFGVAKGRHYICNVFCGNLNGKPTVKIYIGGVLKGTLSGRNTKGNNQLDPKGVLIVGQDQDSLGGGFPVRKLIVAVLRD